MRDGRRAAGEDASEDGLLTRDEVAALLRVKPRQVERLGVPCLDLGRKTKRYAMGDVREWLAERRRAQSS